MIVRSSSLSYEDQGALVILAGRKERYLNSQAELSLFGTNLEIWCQSNNYSI